MTRKITLTLLLAIVCNIMLAQEKTMAAYLMVYHKDADHGLHMAVSHDGYTFTALNSDKPVIAGDTISQQHGIRDPHIFRGPDGSFYLSMTDLHVYGRREGHRNTEWERSAEDYGWGNNRALVLMKSRDLIHWTRANINITQLDSTLAEAGCAWAPETAYDEETGRMMLHFTMRFGNGVNALYYAYVSDAYDRLLTLPKLLLEAPGREYSIIDGDIVPHQGRYHLFFVGHNAGAGIYRAVSDHITGPYTIIPQKVSTETIGHEAPNVWQRIGEQRWVLMYDIYRHKPATFGFDESTDMEHFTHVGQFNDERMQMSNCTSPKHGAVVQITAEEAKRLENLYK